MNPTNILKRAPKWAWFAGAGVGLGVIGIRLYRDRGAPTDTTQTGTTSGGVPGSQASSPTPVIVPPVITNTGDNSGSGDAAGILTAVSGVFVPVIDDLTGLVQTTVGGNSELALAGYGAIGSNNDSWLQALMSGGLAPQPAAAQPTVINVTAPAAPSAPAAPPQGPAKTSACGGKYPFQSARGCYRVALAHGERWHYYAPNDTPKERVA